MGEDKKIGILGGTFNPIHMGHLILAEQAYEQYNLDKVLIMPSGVSYMKDKKDILPMNDRCKMASLAISDNPHFELSTIEMERKGNTYTCDTISYLNKRHPDVLFYFIIGADTLYGLENWKNIEQIFSGCTLLVAVRNENTPIQLKKKIEDYKTRYQADIRLLYSSNIEISSEMIRSKCMEHKSIRYFVPFSVEEYISKNGLYRGRTDVK